MRTPAFFRKTFQNFVDLRPVDCRLRFGACGRTAAEPPMEADTLVEKVTGTVRYIRSDTQSPIHVQTVYEEQKNSARI
jgi:hypothetical protein